MSSRRIPLGEVPNAANSPFRAVAAAASKRSHEQVEAQEDLSCDVQPRVKRQALGDGYLKHKSPSKRQGLQAAEGRVFDRQPIISQPTAFQKKLLAAREDKLEQRVEKQKKAANAQIDEIRQWQKHYKKLFPSFVFYFESVPEDVRASCSKNVKSLGAREEKFFSRDVTHVVTTRPIPADTETRDATDVVAPSSTSTSSQSTNQPRTINPSCLERHSEYHGQQNQSKNKFTLEAPTNKRTHLVNSRDAEPRKSAGNADILFRAREMGIKVWPLGKLLRATRAMFDIPNDSHVQTGYASRMKSTVSTARGDREADLSRMLRNERINGPSDRDASVAFTELIPFKGHHIYVRDMDEKTKPILVRDYPRPSRDEDGEWPQFHSVGLGKCPFVPEADPPTRQEFERVKAREEGLRARGRAEARVAPRIRATAHRGRAESEPAKAVPQQKPLEESRRRGNASMRQQAKMPSKELCPPPSTTTKKSPAKIAKEGTVNSEVKLFGGEPAASGMQPSNITSAIRSQMISSTAAAPGAKAGTSKEVHGLKRKVLEKNTGPALTNVQTRQRTIDLAGHGRAERTISAARITRRPVHEPLIHIDEETTQSEEDEDVWMAEDARSKRKQSREVVEKKNPKPGYCENCRDKYDDFDDHIIDRKHRKFALTPENWKDLDRLLAHLGRRLKDPGSDGF